MEVVSFKLYQRKLIFDDLPAMFYNGRGRERVGLAGGRARCVGGGGEGEGGTDRHRHTGRELHSEFVLFFNCFAGDCT